MLKKLLDLQKKSYAKLTKFPVAAILVVDNDDFAGVNVESDILSSSICAERNAIFSAIAAGKSPIEFKEMHILGGTCDKYMATPCGVCRQLIYEFSPSMIIYMYNKNGDNKKCSISELLPLGFRKEGGE